jgi:23S rRNA pseudouridine955/2504/2580 synthase
VSEERRVGADDDGIRLDRWFARHVPGFTFAAVARAARTGAIRLDGARTEPSARVRAGQSVRVPPLPAGAAPDRPARPPVSPEDAALVQGLVMHRDADALVLNKPPGLATQGGRGTTRHIDGMLDALAFDAPARPKLVHRLDRDTSGALLLARSARAAAHFAKAFAGREARKVYWAVVVGGPKADRGVVDAPLGKQPGTGGERMHVDDSASGLPARTRFRVIDRAGNRAAFVEFQPLTGRTHQIRVHAAWLGCPIVGDGKYGGAEAFLTGAVSRKLHLHARRLVIPAPGGGMLDVTADLPEHLAATLATLGFDPAMGDALPIDEPKFADTPEGRAKLEAAQAKARRKARRGERRRRGEERA